MQYFLLNEQDNIAVLTMNQPGVCNRFGLEVVNELIEILSQIEKNDNIHGLIITGAGKVFSAGADIKQMIKMDKDQAVNFLMLVQTAFNKIEKLKNITVAAINGHALAGGCELALACDYRIAVEGAKLGLPEINIGIIPSCCGCSRLIRTVGLSAAKKIIYTGGPISSREALKINLVDKVVSKDKLFETAKNLLSKLLSNSSLILQFAKEAVRAGVTLSDEQAELRERELFRLCFDTQDRMEGMNAFIEKRKPDFKHK